MNLGHSDFRKLRASIAVCVVMIAAGAGALLVSANARETARQTRVSATAERNESEGKLRRVRDEESEIKQKSLLFNQLQERGVVGEEQRLDWIELLKDIRDRRRLIDLHYDISPQRPVDSGAVGDFAFHASTMRLQLKLLHEEDLTRLLGDLRQQAKALVRVNSCKVERLPPATDERSSSRANLQADCEIDWLTLHDVSRK